MPTGSNKYLINQQTTYINGTTGALINTEVKQCNRRVIDISISGIVIELSATISAIIPERQKRSPDIETPSKRLIVKALSTKFFESFLHCTIAAPIPVSEKPAKIITIADIAA